jgi:DNA primase
MESSRDQIEEIKSRLDIVNIIGKYVQLKRTGKNFSGICPFHVEKTPSFIVSPELQRYKCFGCGESGDIFNFVQKIENIDFSEALEKLAKEAGVPLVKKKINTQFQRLEEINRKAAIYFFKQLKDKKSVVALEYVHKRGITDDSIQKFGIGYAPGGMGLLEYIQREEKYSKQELLQSGLFIEKEGKLRGKFFKRIMFPIRSSSGKVIAFTGRVLPGNEYGPKYMNSPETPIYHKSDNLYGQYESRQKARKEDFIILCEGTTDVISAHQIGVENIVAPLGTALTKEQLAKISRLSKNVLFLFDSDTAGQKAVESAFILSQELSLNTYATNTSPYKDIDEMINKEPKEFKSLVKRRIDAYTYLLTEYIKDKNLNNFEDYRRIVSWMESTLSHVKNRSNFLFYVKSSVNITKIEPFKSGVNKAFLENGGKSEKITLKRSSNEAIFLQSLLFQKNFKVLKNFDLKFFSDEKILEILSFVSQNPNISRGELIEKYQEDPVIKTIIEDSIFSFTEGESNLEELSNIYDNIVRSYYVRKEEDFRMQIASAEQSGNIKQSVKLFKEFQDLIKEKQDYEKNNRL